MTNKSTTLTSFQATSIDDITEPTPELVIESFADIQFWETEISINDQVETYLVGPPVDTRHKAYELYYPPESPHGAGLAGTITHKHVFGDSEDDTVAFRPRKENEEQGEMEDQPIVPVTSLQVREHTRTDQLDAVLPLVRDHLMDTDWIVDPASLSEDELDLSRGMFLVDPEDIDSPEDEDWLPIRGDAGYGEWLNATNTLAAFYEETYDDGDLCLSPQTILQTRVMHGIARYPLSATKLLSQVDEDITENNENPEALRTLLIDYAVKNIPVDKIDEELTASMVSH